MNTGAATNAITGTLCKIVQNKEVASRRHQKRKGKQPRIQGTTKKQSFNSIANSQLAPISTINPRVMVRDSSDKVGLFFLMLSVVFNDLKDLAELVLLVQSEQKRAQGLSHIELRGRHTMLHRHISGAMHELMELISSERKILDEEEFQHVVNRLHPITADIWKTMTGIALSHGKERSLDSSIKRALVTVRNAVAFHYTATSSMAKAWEAMASRNPDRNVPYSMGINTAGTRFHYADAAVQHIVDDLASRFLNPQEDPPFDVITARLVEVANQALGPLLHAFIDNRATLDKVRAEDAKKETVAERSRTPVVAGLSDEKPNQLASEAEVAGEDAKCRGSEHAGVEKQAKHAAIEPTNDLEPTGSIDATKEADHPEEA